MPITVADAAVDISVEALTGMAFWVLPAAVADVLTRGLDLNKCAVPVTSFEFAAPGPSEECRC